MHSRALALALLVFASPASALENLTGTWEGVLKCRTLDGGETGKTKEAVTLEVVDSGVGGLQMELLGTDLLFIGFTVAESGNAQKGVLSSASCGFAFDNLDGGTLQADVKTKAGSPKASLKARLSLMTAAQGIARSCTLNAKRVNDAQPDIIGCAI
jgi:hypothetical protein